MRIFRMAFVGGFAGALMAGNVGTLSAAPLPTNVATIKSMVADSSIRVRWGGWRGRWAYRGFGGFGYRGCGWGVGALAGAVIGGAIASSAYGGYYGGPAYGYGGPPYGDYYPGYSYYPAYVGPYYGSWEAIQEPGAFGFRPSRPRGYW